MNVATPPGAVAAAPPPHMPARPIAPARGTPVASPHPPMGPTVTPAMPSGPSAPPPPLATPAPFTGPAPMPPAARGGLGASMSMPIAARRPWGLIVVVLLIDLGLAVAGSILLRQGLATASTGSATPAAGSAAAAAGTTSQ